MNAARHAYERVISHIWMGHVTIEWVMSRIRTSHFTHTHESCHRYENWDSIAIPCHTLSMSVVHVSFHKYMSLFINTCPFSYIHVSFHIYMSLFIYTCLFWVSISVAYISFEQTASLVPTPTLNRTHALSHTHALSNTHALSLSHAHAHSLSHTHTLSSSSIKSRLRQPRWGVREESVSIFVLQVSFHVYMSLLTYL